MIPLNNPESLARLKAWSLPRIGALSDLRLLELQEFLEAVGEAFGVVPLYRVE